MISEWMKVMLGEISRKKAEEEQMRSEEQARSEEQRRIEQQRRSEEGLVIKSAKCTSHE
jgi:hypothetical protein